MAQDIYHTWYWGWPHNARNRDEKNYGNISVSRFTDSNDREFRTIYSYGSHYPMATVIRGDDGTEIDIILRGNRYSVTTSKHMSDTRWAIPKQDVSTAKLIDYFCPVGSQSVNHGAVLGLIKEHIRVEPTARSEAYKRVHQSVLLDNYALHEQMFNEFIATKKRPSQKAEGEWSDLMSHWNSLFNLFQLVGLDTESLTPPPPYETLFTPEAIASKKALDAEKKVVDALVAVVNAMGVGLVDAAVDRLAEMLEGEADSGIIDRQAKIFAYDLRESLIGKCGAELEQLEKMRKIPSEVAKLLSVDVDGDELQAVANNLFYRASRKLSDIGAEKMWLAGVSDQTPRNWGYGFPTRLRVLFDGNNWRVNTSRSATVPQTTVKRLWRMMRVMLHKDQAYFVDAELDAEPYRGVEIKFGEELTVGCHHIPWDQIEYVRSVLEERFPGEWLW